MIRALNTMRPRIVAERQLQQIKVERILGMKPHPAQAAIRRLERTANGGGRRTGQVMKTATQWAQAGMRVNYVPKEV